MQLQGKSIVVIGGTSGLGLSAARAFVRQGAQVIVAGRDPAKSEAAAAALGPNAAALVGDASQPQLARQCIDSALQRFGRFDGLYHVAGGSGRRQGDGPLDQISDAGWAYTLNENLTSVFNSNRAAVQQFLKQGTGGAVLNMSSVLAFSPAPKHFSTQGYAATKAAIIGLSRSAAAQYAGQGIRFNVLAPALVATPMSQRAQDDAAILQYIATKQPLDGGRIGHPDDLDAAAIYFMSDDARFVTGQVLAIDGGWSVSEGQYDRV
ncbi:MAG: SDR family oxidoreductase [Verrucomicrobiota bacterium]